MTESIDWAGYDGYQEPVTAEQRTIPFPEGVGIHKSFPEVDPLGLQDRYQEAQCSTAVPHLSHVWAGYSTQSQPPFTYHCNGVKEIVVDELTVKVREIHAWLAELMPMARQAQELLDKKAKLFNWSLGGGKRG